MKKSANYSLNLPEPDDYVIIGDLNYNTEEIDKLIKSINDALAVLSTNGANLMDLLKKKADLDANNKVLVSQLPDLDVYKDVLMYEVRGNFPSGGNTKKLYVDKSTGRIYRWTGTAYAELSKSLDIGIRTGTAFDGKRGKDLEDKVNMMYTNPQINKLLADLKKSIIEEVQSDIIEQILAYS